MKGLRKILRVSWTAKKTNEWVLNKATLPCNSSLMAGFDDISVSQRSIGTYARCGGIFSIDLTTI